MGHQGLARNPPREAAVTAPRDARRAGSWLSGRPPASDGSRGGRPTGGCSRRSLLAAGLGHGVAGGLALAGLATPRPAAARGLQQVRESGRLSVALYQDMPPFHADGQGIDAALAGLLAEGLGVTPLLRPFNADDSMNDDLRNMVWRGHYLAGAPADVLLHVPVERPLIEATPQAKIFAPYYRESVAIARSLEQLPQLDALQALAGRPVAVPGQSLAGWLLLGADGGVLRETLRTRWSDGTEAARALQRGEVVAASGLRSELESVLGRDTRFAIDALPTAALANPLLARGSWAIGCAVKADAADLALALQQVIDGLAADGRLAALFARAGVAWRRA